MRATRPLPSHNPGSVRVIELAYLACTRARRTCDDHQSVGEAREQGAASSQHPSVKPSRVPHVPPPRVVSTSMRPSSSRRPMSRDGARYMDIRPPPMGRSPDLRYAMSIKDGTGSKGGRAAYLSLPRPPSVCRRAPFRPRSALVTPLDVCHLPLSSSSMPYVSRRLRLSTHCHHVASLPYASRRLAASLSSPRPPGKAVYHVRCWAGWPSAFGYIVRRC